MGRRFLILGGLILTILFSAIVAGLFLLLEDYPAVADGPAPTPEDVVAARTLVRDLRLTSKSGPDAQTPVQVTVAQLNSTVRLGARFLPGFRGELQMKGATLVGRASIPVPGWWGEKWVNLSGHVPEFNGRIAFERVTIGPWSVPPGAALSVVRQAANLFFGDAVGDTIVAAATGMHVDGNKLRFDLALEQMGNNGLMRNIFGSIRGQEFPTPEEIDAAYVRIRTAMDTGVLPTTGSFLPYLHYTLRDALEHGTAGTGANAYTAAMFGLTRVCGPPDFGDVVGRLAITDAGADQDWATNCSKLTLNGRIDSRRHFIASAALRAAANRGISYSIGEFKELHDTVSGAGGFDFTDIAANLSGIRLTDYFMSLPQDAWPAALNRLGTEHAFLIAFDGIPSLMPEAGFNARFGTVESAAYQDMVQQIELRIDGLRLYENKQRP